MFCEGTRFTNEKHKASIEVAKKKGLPEFKHHLLPRTRGFNLVMEIGKNKSKNLCIISYAKFNAQFLKIVDAIYDCTLVIKSESKPNISMIIDGVPTTGQMLINRIPIKDVPIGDENECKKFLYKMYEKKVSNTHTA